ncbi:unnamed protein product, partial [Discosporangium mesarthrocarpum]
RSSGDDVAESLKILPPAVPAGRSVRNSPVVLSNEVLLRSKIAELEGKGKGAGSKGELDAVGAKGHKGGGGRGAGKKTTVAAGVESEEDLLRRFDIQLAQALHPGGSGGQRYEENGPGSSPKERDGCKHFSEEGKQEIRGMYSEQMRGARWSCRQADVLAHKTEQLEHANQVMCSEMEHCEREISRLDSAASRLQALSVELDGRRKTLLEQRAEAAAREAAKREKMNSSLNQVVQDISAKIKEQEAERISQEQENTSLREELQAHIMEYEEKSKAFTASLAAQEEERVRLEERLGQLTAAAEEASARENAVQQELDDLLRTEAELVARVSADSSRFDLQQAGLKEHAKT